jgi:hypothetical protein
MKSSRWLGWVLLLGSVGAGACTTHFTFTGPESSGASSAQAGGTGGTTATASSSGTSSMLNQSGQACTASDECATDSCLGGFCCSGACLDQGAASCGTNGTCASGTGACQRYPAGTSCSNVVACSNAVLTTDNQCDGNGNCSEDATAVPCPGGFACSSSTSCATTCAQSADCASGFTCQVSTHTCIEPAGGACTSNGECSIGLCLSGFCCSSACNTTGLCAVTACAPTTGACRGPVATVCVAQTNSCSDSNLTGLSVCDGTGNCKSIPTIACVSTCGPNGCDPCDATDPEPECPYGYCDSTRHCQPQQYSGATCTANDMCLSNVCTTGTCQ